AKRIAGFDNCKREVGLYEKYAVKQDSLILTKDRQIALLKSEILNYSEIDKTYKGIQDGLKSDLSTCDKKNTRLKMFVKILSAVALVATGVAVLK
ncbi:MAG: hypothetical protein WD512_05115, partial [Candidatus Paceibacterota bacterium]